MTPPTLTTAPPKERPILFSSSMVRAILEGRKTVTRRVIKGAMPYQVSPWNGEHRAFADGDKIKYGAIGECPHGRPNEVLWVRETWRPRSWGVDFDWMCVEYRADQGTDAENFKLDVNPYEMWSEDRATDVWQGLSDECRAAGCALVGEMFTLKGNKGQDPIKWRPSIFMPRAACRLKLRITDVRVERLHQITAAQCIAEGIHIERDINTPCGEVEAFNKMIELWDGINAKRGYGWETNPYVWAVEFEVIED